ncbi:GAF domain-containing protein [Sporocytophaga myxococcoides]|uniref:GAF domain-containing protein n=1 Tax=Sporocytophaga myxococcoides TaxID=153721 RepID=UPI00041302B5|nr:GAF domain-containing protein [Sporocytophaga myxococcoides]
MENNPSKKNYDSDFCGNLPLNFINSIQPYGALIVVEKRRWTIIQVSENIRELFGKEVIEILNNPLSTFLSKKDYEALLLKINDDNLKERVPLNFSFNNLECLAIAHFKDGQVVMELERVPAIKKDFSYLYQDVKYIVAKLKNVDSITQISKIACEEIKRISGFDKVMIYQFDESWNGLVIAEARNDDMDVYLGLRFPASDIPKQARELYFNNPYRFIPDRSYKAVKLNPILNPVTFRYTDLGDCNLRAVAPVHLEYLQNMKVETSMSTPIIKNDKLWGLISCHHRTAREIPYDLRSAFELLSSILSTQLVMNEKQNDLLVSSHLDSIQSRLYRQMTSAPNFTDGLLENNNLLELLEIQGAVIVFNGKTGELGKTPETSFIKELSYWLKVKNIDEIFHSDTTLMELDANHKYKEDASGIIVIPISVKRGEYIVGFRPEIIQTVHWGGNPDEAIQFESDQKTYHPRNSFGTWKETVKNTSKAWTTQTLKAADELHKSITDILYKNQN